MTDKTTFSKQCPGCKDIQSIVLTNEQMIQEQIKLIKKLHQQNNELTEKNSRLTLQLEKLEGQLKKWTFFSAEKQDQNQQTQWSFVEGQMTIESNPQDALSMRVSTKVNIQAVEEKKKKAISNINKENLHEVLPMYVMRKNEQYFSRKRKNSTEQDHHSSSWLKIMQPRVHPLSAAKFREKTVHLVKKMIPHQIRHRVWPAASENDLMITDQLYCELQERKAMGWVSKEVRLQIQRDIARSFSTRQNVQDKERLKIEVSQVLELFHLYRPDISYVQGMTYPIIVLTVVVGKVKAFRMFCNLAITKPFWRKIFTFEPQFIKALSRAFELILSEYQHDVAEKLASVKVESEIFLVQWFYTIFSRNLSFEGTIKFWDQLIYHGEVVLFRMALGIFELIKPHIMETNYQDTVGLIQGFGSYIRENKLLDIVVSHKLSDQKLQKYLEKAERKFSEERQ